MESKKGKRKRKEKGKKENKRMGHIPAASQM
jgi:hypothetical protein